MKEKQVVPARLNCNQVQNMNITINNTCVREKNKPKQKRVASLPSAKIQMPSVKEPKKKTEEDIKTGMLLAYQSVREEMEKIKMELKRKGIEEPKVFSGLDQFISDSINDLDLD